MQIVASCVGIVASRSVPTTICAIDSKSCVYIVTLRSIPCCLWKRSSKENCRAGPNSGMTWLHRRKCVIGIICLVRQREEHGFQLWKPGDWYGPWI